MKYKFTEKEINSIMDTMGWTESTESYKGVKRTVALALEYGRTYSKPDKDEGSDPYDIEAYSEKVVKLNRDEA